MAALTRIAILFCGQGMSTLIEYYPDGDADGAPTHLSLVDMGGNQRHADIATKYVVEKLMLQATAGLNPTFDTVVISHQDGDHLSLLKNLTAAIGEAPITVSCDNFYLGGASWSATNKKRVKDFANEMVDEDDDPMTLAFNEPYESDYIDATSRAEVGYITRFGKTFLRVVISGLKVSGVPEDILRNASSTVVAVENGEWSVILPGDATYQTMEAINDYYTEWGAKPLIPRVGALEIPHHGALRTAVENYDAQKPLDKLDFKIIKQFAKNMSPLRIAASAGPRNSHNHPVKEVLDVFDGSLEAMKSHPYVAWVFNKKKSHKSQGWAQFTSLKAVETTVKQIDGSELYGHILLDLRDSTAKRREVPTVTFMPVGTVEELLARSDFSTEDDWLRDAVGRKPVSEAVLRAPPPGPGPRS